jgi:hypothetical protein
MPAATLIQVLSIVGSALVALKLLKTGLFRKYAVFFLYLLFRIPDTLIPMRMEVTSANYFRFWIATEPVFWAFFIFVAQEISSLIFKKHKGVSTFGRWAMYGGIGASVLISLATKYLNDPHSIQGSTMAWYLGAERGITLGVAVFLLLLLVFLSRYPVPMARNLLGHLAIYTVYFFSIFLVFLVRSVFGKQMNDEANFLLSVVSALCMFAWFIFVFNLKGEEVRASLPTFSPEYERRALLQLEALNTTLLKAARK